MNVGTTGVARLERASERSGGTVLGKLEFENPTGSFKDRGSIAEIGEAARLGKRGVVCASTGNMAISLSYFARAAGIASTVVVPRSTPRAKIAKITSCGGDIVPVSGTYDDCVGVAEEIARIEDLLLCGDYLIRRQGQRAVGTEIAPLGADVVAVPFGNGTLLVAIAEGFYAARTTLPALLAARPVTPGTIASACAVRSPLDGALAARWVDRSGGRFVDVTDDEIRTAERRLREDGPDVEYSAAAALAAFEKALLPSRKAVLVLTGNNK